jgi:5-methylcytosine-specific restriction protein A
MPSLPKRYCTAPSGCANLSTGGLCIKHRKARDLRRKSSHERGYDSTWRRLRLMKLARQSLCEANTHCQHPTPATEVDHRIPIAHRPDLRLTMTNLQSLCHTCHSAKTMREQHGTYSASAAPQTRRVTYGLCQPNAPRAANAQQTATGTNVG